MTCASEGTVELFLEPKHVDPLLLIVGSSPIAFALEELAPRFSLRPRRISLEEAASGGSAAEDPLENLRGQLPVHPKTAVYGVVATMGLYDVEGLLALSALPLRYLGVVTSPKRWRTLRAGLEEGGAPSAFIDFITAPAGLNIGAVGPEEIALSILAQVVERRRRGVGGGWEGQVTAGTPVTGGSPAPACGDREADRHVIDPVCGMTVDLATTPYRLEWEGTTYGFCCPGCRNRFARDPHAYVQNHA
jgi:xanthine dehydrogenase accessory factor